MRTLLVILLLTACSADVMPDARYVGSAIPTVPNDLCKSGQAALRLNNGNALFIPDETTWTLTGTANANGTFQAERTGTGVNKQPYSTRITGTWTTRAASGTYTTPRCTYAVQLTRR